MLYSLERANLALIVQLVVQGSLDAGVHVGCRDMLVAARHGSAGPRRSQA